MRIGAPIHLPAGVAYAAVEGVDEHSYEESLAAPTRKVKALSATALAGLQLATAVKEGRGGKALALRTGGTGTARSRWRSCRRP